MSDQNHLELAAHYTVRNQIFGPKFLERFLHAGQLMVSVEIRFAKAGKMFGSADHSGGMQAGKKLASIKDCLFGIGRNYA